MTHPIASRTRIQIRHPIGYNLGAIIVSAASASAADKTTFSDTYMLARGGTDAYKGRQLQVNTLVAGGTTVGEKAFVTGFTSPTLTIAPELTLAVKSTQEYELWEGYLIEEINNLITQAEVEVINDCLQDKEAHTTFTESERYQYTMPTGFVAIHSLEYVSAIDEKEIIHNCEVVWDELVDGDVTASRDTVYEKEGSACLKLVVAAGCAAGDILATMDISSLDLTGCDEVEIWIRSSVALDAGDIQLLLGDTAQCASTVEALAIPATTANTDTRHVISLANPHLDSAIISVGLKMVVDKTTFTLYADDIIAVNSNSRIYKLLNPAYWDIVRGSTDYLKLTQAGLSVCGTPKMLRLTGYQKATIMTADTSTSEIDPDFIIARVTGRALAAHAKSREMDTKDRKEMAEYWKTIAELRKIEVRTDILAGTKWL